MFFCEFCEISKNTSFTEHLQSTASYCSSVYFVSNNMRFYYFTPEGWIIEHYILHDILVKYLVLHCRCFYCFFIQPQLECFSKVRNKQYKSSHQRCSVKKSVLRIFAKFTRNTCARVSFFNKVEGLRPATLIKEKLCYRCFLVNFAKFLRTPFMQITFGRLLLAVTKTTSN